MKKLKMAVIGLGMGASHGARVIKDDNAELTAVCDTNGERIKTVLGNYARELNVSENDLPAAYTDMAEMYKNEKLDAVIVGLPTGLHSMGCIAAAENGVHVLCDKPLDINVAKCDEIIAACDKAGVRLGVIYPMHFEPLLAGIKKAIDDKLIGDLLMADVQLKWHRTQEYYDKGGWRGTWAMDGGGSLMNQGAHPVDYLCWLCGEPDEITGDFSALNHKIETEDWALGIVRFKNGVRGSILTTTNVLPNMNMRRIEVHGTTGSIMIEDKKLDGKASEPINVSTVPNLEELGKREFDYPVGQFIDAILNDTPLEVTGQQGRNSIAVIEGVYRSAREGKRIKV